MPIKIALDNGVIHYLSSYFDVNYYDNIIELDISHNEEIFIRYLPKKLKIFRCNNNYLKKLPVIPESLEELDCSNNLISELPNIKNIKKLVCFNNKFEKNYFEKYTNIEIIK